MGRYIGVGAFDDHLTSMQIKTISRVVDSFRRHPQLIRLACGVQHYDWGDPDAIPDMLGKANPTRRPFAELWAGAHPDLPATAHIDGIRVPLDNLIAGAPEQILGPGVAQRFDNELPFLLKILAAGKPLSIQTHPDDKQARTGFERENRVGLPLDAATRNYHDPHHKPELLVALTDFFSLRGFRPLGEIVQLLTETQELAPLNVLFRTNGHKLAPLYAHIMHLEQNQADAMLSPLIERLEHDNRRHAFTPSHRAYWLLRANREYSNSGHRDLGLFSMLLLNLVQLRPRQAVFLPAGELHAYLQGVGIELMTNSNNVLRGGLTHKFVDVDELLNTLSFRTAAADLIEGIASSDEPGLISYPAPAGEFSLCSLDMAAGHEFTRTDGKLALILIAAGTIQAHQENQPPLVLHAGEALLAPAGIHWRVHATKNSVCWLARVPPKGVSYA